MTEANDTTNFEDRFDPIAYLSQCYHKPGTPQNYCRDLRLKMVHEFFCEFPPVDDEDCPKDIKVLDYGSGPVIAFVISAAGKKEVSEIVLADYTEMNRSALRKWIDRDVSSFDWSCYFKHIVQDLEKKAEKEIRAREDRLRSIAKVASCDIKADQVIEKGFEGPYDVVITFLAIESACTIEADYLPLVEKLSRHVKPEGHILMFIKIGKRAQSMSYNVGGKLFHYFTPSEEIVLSSLGKAGFNSIQYTITPAPSVLNSISGLSSSKIEAINQSTMDNKFFYMSVRAKKTT